MDNDRTIVTSSEPKTLQENPESSMSNLMPKKRTQRRMRINKSLSLFRQNSQVKMDRNQIQQAVSKNNKSDIFQLLSGVRLPFFSSHQSQSINVLNRSSESNLNPEEESQKINLNESQVAYYDQSSIMPKKNMITKNMIKKNNLLNKSVNIDDK